MLQPKLNLRVSQRQVLTPGLVQMVSVLALNKLELKDMINSEMIENPLLEELEESGASLEERAGLEGDRERSADEVAEEAKREFDKAVALARSSDLVVLTVGDLGWVAATHVQQLATPIPAPTAAPSPSPSPAPTVAPTPQPTPRPARRTPHAEHRQHRPAQRPRTNNSR